MNHMVIRLVAFAFVVVGVGWFGPGRARCEDVCKMRKPHDPSVVLHMEQATQPVMPTKSAKPEIWRSGEVCGANTVYVLLKLIAPDAPEYVVIRRELPSTQATTSILEMKCVLAQHGVEAEIVRASPQTLASYVLPVIAHFQRDRDWPGHFVVLLAADDRVMRVVDGSTGMISDIPRAQFLNLWSGALLVPLRTMSSLVPGVCFTLGGVLLAVLLAPKVAKHMSTSRRFRKSVARLSRTCRRT